MGDFFRGNYLRNYTPKQVPVNDRVYGFSIKGTWKLRKSWFNGCLNQQQKRGESSRRRGPGPYCAVIVLNTHLGYKVGNYLIIINY